MMYRFFTILMLTSEGTIIHGGMLVLRRGFGTFGWSGAGRCSDSEAGKTYDTAAAMPPAFGVPPTGPAGSVALSQADGTRLMPGQWPRGSRPWVSRPTVRPAERIGKSSRASNLKSQPVAFCISRPTRTPTAGSPP
jgi:hypothetical protein